MADVVILLSDGMENVEPYYDTPEVKGIIEPTGTIIHTVALGSTEAGHHDRLQEVADDNGGRAYQVIGTGMAPTSAQTDRALSSGLGTDAWPMSLGNRLADTYKQIAEEILHENRLFQVSGFTDPETGAELLEWTVEVPEGLRRLTFALNWEEKDNELRLWTIDPDGTDYRYLPEDPQEDAACRTDATHETCIIDHPVAGEWTLAVLFDQVSTTNEYAVWASAQTPIDFRLYVATPPRERTPVQAIHLLAFLEQEGEPLARRQVSVNVFLPDDRTYPLTLLDDGEHGDGTGGDGVYGAYFFDNYPFDGIVDVGPHAVRGRAEGLDSQGRPFTLYQNTTFHVRPCILYVYAGDDQAAQDIRSLLERHGFTVDFAKPHAVASLQDLHKYTLIIIAADTGSRDTWEPVSALEALDSIEVPILGLGDGGYAFFGKLEEHIGYPNGEFGQGTSIAPAIPSVFSDPIWEYPYDLQASTGEPLQLYTHDSPRVSIDVTQPPLGVVTYGYNDANSSYADLVVAKYDRYMLWSFEDPPKAMTQIGLQLFVNAVHSIAH